MLSLDLPPSSFSITWRIYGLAMFVAGFLMNWRIRSRPGSGAIRNRTERAVWFTAGLAMLGVFVGAAAHSLLEDNGAQMGLIAPAVSAACATALLTTGRMIGDRLLIGAAFVAYCIAAASVALLYTPALYLVAAAGAFATLVVAVLFLARREHSEIV